MSIHANVTIHAGDGADFAPRHFLHRSHAQTTSRDLYLELAPATGRSDVTFVGTPEELRDLLARMTAQVDAAAAELDRLEAEPGGPS